MLTSAALHHAVVVKVAQVSPSLFDKGFFKHFQDYQDLEQPPSIPILSISPPTDTLILSLKSASHTYSLLRERAPTAPLTPLEPVLTQWPQSASCRALGLLSFALWWSQRRICCATAVVLVRMVDGTGIAARRGLNAGSVG